jgi:hypothetical protein
MYFQINYYIELIMSLQMSTNKEIKRSLSNFNFLIMIKKSNLERPTISNGNYIFTNVESELSFIMAYKGFFEGTLFTATNVSTVENMKTIVTDFDNIKEATLNLHFMSCAKQINLSLPNCINHEYSFSHPMAEVAFQMFYLGWRSALNNDIFHFHKDNKAA